MCYLWNLHFTVIFSCFCILDRSFCFCLCNVMLIIGDYMAFLLYHESYLLYDCIVVIEN